MKELKATEGYYLTQSADVADNERIFTTAIKGENVNESDWREATKEEKAEWERAQESQTDEQ